MRILAVTFIALVCAVVGGFSQGLSMSVNSNSVIVIADVTEVSLKTLYFDREHRPSVPYSLLSLAIVESLFGDFTNDKPVLSPCVAYCDSTTGEARIRMVSGQTWFRPGDRVVLKLKEYHKGGELVWIVKGTRFLSDGVVDTSRLVRSRPASISGVSSDLCDDRVGAVLNEYVDQQTMETEQTLGELKSRCRQVEHGPTKGSSGS